MKGVAALLVTSPSAREDRSEPPLNCCLCWYAVTVPLRAAVLCIMAMQDMVQWKQMRCRPRAYTEEHRHGW